MKKRKVKLFASIASLAMVVAVMGVGVWAATNQSVAVNSSVSFQSVSIAGDLKLQISGDVASATGTAITDTPNLDGFTGATAADYKTAPVTLATFAEGDAVTTFEETEIKVLAQADLDGFINDGDQIIYTFTFTNTTDAYYKITLTGGAESQYSAAIYTVNPTDDGATAQTGTTYTSDKINKNAGATFYVVYTLDLTEGDKTAVSVSEKALAKIDIKFANNATLLA